MQGLLNFITENGAMLATGIWETLAMTLISALFAYLLGLPLGVLLVITAKDGIRPMRAFSTILNWVINVGRSIPFIILMLALIPVTRAIVGTSIGYKAAIVALVVGAAPFIARLVETSLKEVDPGVVEAARTMGATDWQIITKVLLPEALPALVRGGSITTIMLIGYTAMAGAVGSGGLGAIAIRYGYHRYQPGLMYVSIIIIVVMVQVIQWLFNITAKLIDKRSR